MEALQVRSPEAGLARNHVQVGMAEDLLQARRVAAVRQVHAGE